MRNNSEETLQCDAVKNADLPDFSQVEQLHRTTAPSESAYNLIHGHCVVIATISWQIAHHCNMLLEFKTKCSSSILERSKLAQSCIKKLIGDNYSDLPPIKGGRAPKQPIDEYAAFIGGMLHDIGTYFVLKKDGSANFDGELSFDGPNYILHGLRGYNYLLKCGFSEEAAQFARNHTGVGLTREQVALQNLPLPVDDYKPQTVEQEIVMVADKYNSKSIPPRFLTVEEYRRKAARFGEENACRWLQLVDQYGEPNIAALADFFNARIFSYFF